MAWLKLSITTNAKRAEELAEFLELFGAQAVSFVGVSDEKIFSQPNEANEQVLWESTEVSGLLPDDVDMDILLVCMRERIGTDAIQNRSISLIEDKDWEQDYKNSVSLQWIGESICICPSWLQPPESAVAPIILDPGLAFGTGTHATTRLCLQWLESIDLNGKTVIDFGCGSGILALACVRLGAEKVYAIDIDPQAIIATNANAEKNNLADKIIATLPSETPIPASAVLVANVLLNPLKELCEELASLVEANGLIGLSGLLGTQTDECLASYEQWFNMNTPIVEQEWAFIDGVRK